MTGELERGAWEAWLSQHPQAHILQTAQWGALKTGFGWQPFYLANETCGALVLFRCLPLGLSVGYLPKGPVGSDWHTLWPALDELCRRQRAIYVRIEPDLWEGENDELVQTLRGYCQAEAPTIQPRRTICIPLTGAEEDWMQRMKQKTRYNIRLSEKKDVQVEISEDIDAFAGLMAITGDRDGFGVHTAEYYRRAYELFAPEGLCVMLIARYEGQPLAGAMIFRRGERSWFLYGGSSNVERNRMPAYLVQWEAMRWSAGQGCREYDLWGAPDHDEQILEEGFQSRSDGLWGVYRFKRGFGGDLRRSAGAWDRVYNRSLYRVFQWVMKRRRSLMQ